MLVALRDVLRSDDEAAEKISVGGNDQPTTDARLSLSNTSLPSTDIREIRGDSASETVRDRLS